MKTDFGARRSGLLCVLRRPRGPPWDLFSVLIPPLPSSAFFSFLRYLILSVLCSMHLSCSPHRDFPERLSLPSVLKVLLFAVFSSRSSFQFPVSGSLMLLPVSSFQFPALQLSAFSFHFQCRLCRTVVVVVMD